MAKIYGIPPFSFQPDTLFLTVSLLDRYLSLKEIPRSKLQLAGMAALMVRTYRMQPPPASRRVPRAAGRGLKEQHSGVCL
jgi:hypothetical protein